MLVFGPLTKSATDVSPPSISVSVSVVCCVTLVADCSASIASISTVVPMVSSVTYRHDERGLNTEPSLHTTTNPIDIVRVSMLNIR